MRLQPVDLLTMPLHLLHRCQWFNSANRKTCWRPSSTGQLPSWSGLLHQVQVTFWHLWQVPRPSTMSSGRRNWPHIGSQQYFRLAELYSRDFSWYSNTVCGLKNSWNSLISRFCPGQQWTGNSFSSLIALRTNLWRQLQQNMWSQGSFAIWAPISSSRQMIHSVFSWGAWFGFGFVGSDGRSAGWLGAEGRTGNRPIRLGCRRHCGSPRSSR